MVRDARNNLRAKDLGIDLASRGESQLFRWFLVCLLFGKPIQQEIAKKAYLNIVKSGITNIDKLANTKWNKLVALLDDAHYVRYDYSTATKLLQIANLIGVQYGTLSKLIQMSTTAHDLEQRLIAIKGIGPVTASIFIEEIAPLWYETNKPHDYETAVEAANILKSFGFDAYIIGGAIRDLWLGLIPKDFDLATNALPQQLKAIPEFINASYTDPAQAYGITRVKLHDQELEIATFRKDIEAHKGRKQTKIVYSDLEDDLRRRDFTINALALDPISNQVIDVVGGIDDLENRLIRFIGVPSSRIKEDPLRIIRAIRFKNQLAFNYHEAAREAIKLAVTRGAIESIATDRIRDELTKLLLHPSRKQAFIDLQLFGILELVLPEVAATIGISQPVEFHAEGDVWQHELLTLDYLTNKPSKRLVWAALLHDIGKVPTIIKHPNKRIRFDRHYAVGAEMAKATLRRLKFSNRDTKDIVWMVYNHLAIDDLPNMRPSHQQRMLGNPAFEDLLELHRADAAASWRPGSKQGHKPRFLELEKIWHHYQSQPPEQKQPSLKKDLGIDGNWLINNFSREFSLTPGPLVGEILQRLDELYKDQGLRDPEAYKTKVRLMLKEHATPTR